MREAEEVKERLSDKALPLAVAPQRLADLRFVSFPRHLVKRTQFFQSLQSKRGQDFVLSM